jgi:hypothetical protein
MRCLFCEDDVPEFDKSSVGYLIAHVTLKEKIHHIHVHGTLENKEMMVQIVEAIIRECNLPLTLNRVTKTKVKSNDHKDK